MAALAVAALLVAVGVSVIMGIYRAVLGSGSHLLITDLYQLIYEPAPAGNGMWGRWPGSGPSPRWWAGCWRPWGSSAPPCTGGPEQVLDHSGLRGRALALIFGSVPLLTWLDTTSAGQAAVEALAAFGRFLAASPWNAAAVLLAMGAAFFAVTWLLLRRAMIRPAK